MKAMLQFFAVALCAAVLTACGGGKKVTDDATIVQPAYSLTTTVVGSGLTAEANDTVTFHLTGYLYDSTKSDFKGTMVENTVGGSPRTLTVGVGLQPTGFDQALLGMQPGGKRTTVLPANLAYGSGGRAATTINGVSFPIIPADTPLVYDFELVSVTKASTIPVTLPSSELTYTDVTVGTGDTAVSGKTVTVRYTGWLYDGTRANLKGSKFDSNTGSTDAVLSVALDGGTAIITGFQNGILGKLADGSVNGMKVGGTRTVIIPPDLAYGATAKAANSTYGVAIPANSTLVFDITLVSVQ